MDLRSNEPYWLKKNAFKQGFPSLDKSKSTDILVIGGGITGALCGYRLLKEGKEFILVDKRDVCNGSTAASTAMLQYEIDVPLHKLIEQRGLETAVSSYRSCEKAIFDLKKIVDDIGSKCHFEFRKSIYFTSRKRDIKMLEEEYRVRKEYGFAVAWKDEMALKNLGLVACAGIESDSGAIMDPYKLAYDLLNFIAQKGVEIYDKTEIKEFKQQGDNLVAVTPDNLIITANHIIHCTGYESIKTTPKKIVKLKSTYALASESFEEMPVAFKDHIYWDTATPYLYLRGTDDGRVIIGGGDENFKNAQKRDTLLGKKQSFLIKQFHNIFPDIYFKPDYIWSGTFGETKDGLPYIGRAKPESNQHYILGFGGNGITYSVMAMEAIIDSLKHTSHQFLEDYRFDR